MATASRDYVLTVARVVLGLVALLHGIAETFGVWGGPRLGGTTADMAASATASPDTIFYVVAIGLMLAGIVLLLGIATRVAGLLVLAVAVWHGVASGRFGAWFQDAKGCEHLLVLAALALVVATHGPGAMKVDLKRPGKKKD